MLCFQQNFLGLDSNVEPAKAFGERFAVPRIPPSRRDYLHVACVSSGNPRIRWAKSLSEAGYEAIFVNSERLYGVQITYKVDLECRSALVLFS